MTNTHKKQCREQKLRTIQQTSYTVKNEAKSPVMFQKELYGDNK